MKPFDKEIMNDQILILTGKIEIAWHRDNEAEAIQAVRTAWKERKKIGGEVLATDLISEIGLPTRLINALQKMGFEQVWQIRAVSDDRLLSHRLIGMLQVALIRKLTAESATDGTAADTTMGDDGMDDDGDSDGYFYVPR